MIRHTLVTLPSRRAVRPLLVCAVAALALTACSDARRVIGLDRSTPDEFAVVAHSPLTLPPNMRALPEPRPGATRPQEQSTTESARELVFGKGKTPAKGQAAAGSGKGLVAKAGAIDPDIRKKVDQETTALIAADKGWLDTLLFWQSNEQPYTVVDPKKEKDRLRQAEAEGKPLHEGAVPTISRKGKAPLEGLF